MTLGLLQVLNTVFCRLGPSKLEGVGVFAIRNIPRGTELTNYYGGELIYHTLDEEEINLLPVEITTLILDRTMFIEGAELVFMSPNCNQIFQAFMNHDDKPNTDGKYALRDIKKGEELTFDYRLQSDTPHKLSQKHLIDKSR